MQPLNNPYCATTSFVTQLDIYIYTAQGERSEPCDLGAPPPSPASGRLRLNSLLTPSPDLSP